MTSNTHESATQTKQVVVLYPDGCTEVLPTPPTWDAMRAIVGGYVEPVQVLDRVEDNEAHYTYLCVNEEGLIRGLPRNAAATEVYQRNVRWLYPGPDPFPRARQAALERYKRVGFAVTEQAEPLPGYATDPWIAGVAVYWQGWEWYEVRLLWNSEE